VLQTFCTSEAHVQRFAILFGQVAITNPQE
jgi:hypothetical protein